METRFEIDLEMFKHLVAGKEVTIELEDSKLVFLLSDEAKDYVKNLII